MWETLVDRPSVGLSLTEPQETEPSPMVAKGTPELLSGDMKKGEPQHQKKAWEERCWERMREMEDKGQGGWPEACAPQENQQFPPSDSCTCSAGSALGQGTLSLCPLSRSAERLVDFLLTPLSPAAPGQSSFGNRSLKQDSPFPSFAQMLRVGKPMQMFGSKPLHRKMRTACFLPPLWTAIRRVITQTLPCAPFQDPSSQATEEASRHWTHQLLQKPSLKSKKDRQGKAEREAPVQHPGHLHRGTPLAQATFSLWVSFGHAFVSLLQFSSI